MKIARFAVYGQIQEGTVREDGNLVATDGSVYAPEEVVWLPPSKPTKAIGLALNYAAHAAELSVEAPPEPALYFKPISSLVGHRAPVIAPPDIIYMHYEVELVVIIGRRCRRIKAERAMEVIAGYTIGNDVTVRDFVYDFYRPPVRAKGYDTFGPVGPYLVTADEIPDPANLELRAFVNGKLRQKGSTSELIRSVPDLIEFISMIMTLEPGDMVWTGTPKGISPIYPGDRMRMEIDGLGKLENQLIPEWEKDEKND